MITVEKVLEKNVLKEAEVAKENNALLNATGSVKEVSGSYWPYIIVGLLAIGGIILLLRKKKGSGINEGVSG